MQVRHTHRFVLVVSCVLVLLSGCGTTFEGELLILKPARVFICMFGDSDACTRIDSRIQFLQTSIDCLTKVDDAFCKSFNSTAVPLTATSTLLPIESETATPDEPKTATATVTVESTATRLPPTDTPVPPTDTPVLPTNTPVPPTDTPVPPTDTPVPPTDTPVPPTDTPVPPTSVPSKPTKVVATSVPTTVKPPGPGTP